MECGLSHFLSSASSSTIHLLRCHATRNFGKLNIYNHVIVVLMQPGFAQDDAVIKMFDVKTAPEK